MDQDGSMTLDGFNTSPDNRLDISEGGFLVGPGSETSDEIYAKCVMATGVLNAEVVRMIGRERLQAIVRMATECRVPLRVSPDEFVVPIAATAAFGADFWQALNEAGNRLRSGTSEDPERERREANRRFDIAMSNLSAISAGRQAAPFDYAKGFHHE